MANPTLIIGGGIGGLSTAIRLAAAGQPVILFEQQPTVGGKMAEVRAAGYRWDIGPSVITMRHVLEELFAIAGRKLDDYLTLLPLEPLTRYFYPDGTILDASRDLSKMAQQLANLDERDVEGYLAYLAYAARLHRITGPAFIYDEPPSWHSLLKASPTDLLQVDAWRNMDAAICAFVRSVHLRQLLGRFATYVGGSPYQAPATLNVIAHVELTGGVWYPQGGIYAIAQALATVASELGVEIRTAQPVSQILVERGRVQGLKLADGSTQPAETVIANVDVTTTYQTLLPPDVATPKRLRQRTRFEPSCSGFIMLWGLNKTHPELAHHNIFFSGDYAQEFIDIFRRNIPPAEPTIYAAITAKTDPDHAPDGHENWFVLVNAPALEPSFDWQTEAKPYRDVVLKRLKRFGLDLAPHIQTEQLMTPLDLAQQTGAWRGALYGASSNSRWTAFRRPHNRCPHLRGLYFVGGTTHPGGGVPMVMLSGKVVAGMVLRDFKEKRG